ncbi:hypothetical protein B0H10DRAFT_2041238, partial [Mycena sp. CBHHK59/15]
MASESRDPNAHAQLLLTETASESDVQQIQLGGPAVTLDDLGPMVVNSDGTLSRIANWLSMNSSGQRGAKIEEFRGVSSNVV